MTDAPLPAVEIEPAAATQAAVIWLHGLGADGHDFADVAPQLRLPARFAVRFVFPHAPLRPVTINGGAVMRAWYDIVDLRSLQWEDAQGIRDAQRMLEGMIRREVERGIPESRIVLAGFSQGGSVALHTGLRYPRSLAGILALSTYLPLAGTLEAERSPANLRTPILLAHGMFDEVVPLRLAASARDRLTALGYPLEWSAYRMGHAVCVEELASIARWLIEVLGDAP